MTGHEWKVLASFGLLLGAISLFDPQTAKYVAGVAIAVVVVKNAKSIPFVGDGTKASARAAAPVHSMQV